MELLTSTLRALNLAERGSEPIAVTGAYGQLAIMAGALGIDRLARRYLSEARSNATACGSPREISGAMLTQLAVHSAHARWREAHQGIDEEVIPLLRERRNSHLAGSFLSFLGANAYYMGDFARAERRARELRALAEAMNNDLHRGWSGCQSACVAMVRGDFAVAEALALGAREALRASYDSTRSTALGVLAVCLFRGGRTREARAVADELLAILKVFSTQKYTGLEAHAGVTSVYLGLRAMAQGSEKTTLLALAEESIQLLEHFASRFAVGRPRALTLRAELMAARGHPLRARGLFRRAAAQARSLEMPYEEALALAAFGRCLRGREAAQRSAEALMRFKTLGCRP